jgi:hypothetical protein
MALSAGTLYNFPKLSERKTKVQNRRLQAPVPTSALREYVRTHAENRRGVYQMLGADGDPLYVGKSIRVRARLLSYFQALPGEKATKLIRETGRIQWEYIPNEFSTLVREMKLIQRWRPQFNVQHKRKRMYAFVKLTREIAPRILSVTRAVPDGSLYFGPFPAVGKVGATARELAHAFLHRVPGFTRESHLYLIRGGHLRREFPYPTSEGERQEIDDAVESVYRAPERGPASLEPLETAEILLVVRWFELRPKELKRTATPAKWLAEGGIRPARRRNRTVGDRRRVHPRRRRTPPTGLLRAVLPRSRHSRRRKGCAGRGLRGAGASCRPAPESLREPQSAPKFSGYPE